MFFSHFFFYVSPAFSSMFSPAFSPTFSVTFSKEGIFLSTEGLLTVSSLYP
jgi:hypothetical protein